MSKRILIVEDDRDTATSVAEILEVEGYKTMVVSDGAEALAALRRDNQACAILLDLRMPNMDGWEFRREQLQDRAMASIPVIAFTADIDVKIAASALGAAGRLAKPTEISALLDEVERVCGPPDES
jgi:CheY-like chemotaxis protein